jgi:hypothetical protein
MLHFPFAPDRPKIQRAALRPPEKSDGKKAQQNEAETTHSNANPPQPNTILKFGVDKTLTNVHTGNGERSPQSSSLPATRIINMP